MVDSTQKKFLVLYLAPPAVMEDWAKKDPGERKAAEEKMKAEWQKWMGAHSKMIISTEVGGKTKRVTSSGIADTKNAIVLFAVVVAESHEAATKAFENHPHLQIPQATIEVMEIKSMGAM
jgi:hypothetical protein